MIYKTSAYILKTTNSDGEMIIKNTLTQKSFKVKHENVEEIEKILSGVYEVETLSNVAKKLYDNGFLVEDFVDESQIVDYLFNKEIYGNKTLELTIIPTNACNFDCVYCYQKEPYFFMSKETMDSIILFIEKHIGEYSGLLISWFGGEPLLAKELMIEFMEKVRMICLKRRIPFYSNVTTNGYELDLKTFKSLITNHVLYYQITIDGPKEIHNKQRPHKTNNDSFEKIVKNLLDIKEKVKGNRYKIAIRVNVSTSVQPYIENFIEWLYNKFGEDNRFTIVWEIVRDWGGEKIKNNKQLILEDQKSKEWMDVLSNKGFSINMGFEDNDLNLALCTASKVNGFVVNYDGNIYKCAMCIENDKYKEINNIGRISQNGDMIVNTGKMVKWLGKNNTDEKCVMCQHYPECMGISCPLGSKILKQPVRCKELFIDDYEYLLRNRDVVRNIEYLT